MVNWLSPKIIFPEVHASLGFGFMMVLRFIVPRAWFWWGLLFVEVVVAVKETVWDPLNESNQPFFWAGAQDLGWYQVGLLIAALA